MKTKAIAGVLAGILSVQSTALAQSRVDRIGEQAIVNAENDLIAVKKALVDMDTMLAQAQKEIAQNRDQNNKTINKILRGTSYVAAAGTLALTGFAIVALRSKSGDGGAGIVGALAGVTAIFTGFTSAASSGITYLTTEQKDELVSEALVGLENARDQVAKAENEAQDESTRASYKAINTTFSEIIDTLKNQTEAMNTDQLAKISADVAQASGAALLVAARARLVPGGPALLASTVLVSSASLYKVFGNKSLDADKVLQTLETQRLKLQIEIARMN